MVDWDDYQYFTEAEDFPHGTPRRELLDLLDLAREIAGVPFRITSGVRSREDNKRVGGGNDSAHMRGYAADILAIDSTTRGKVLRGLYVAGAHRVGIYKEHIHVDVDPSLPEDVCWLAKNVRAS